MIAICCYGPWANRSSMIITYPARTQAGQLTGNRRCQSSLLRLFGYLTRSTYSSYRLSTSAILLLFYNIVSTPSLNREGAHHSTSSAAYIIYSSSRFHRRTRNWPASILFFSDPTWSNWRDSSGEEQKIHAESQSEVLSICYSMYLHWKKKKKRKKHWSQMHKIRNPNGY